MTEQILNKIDNRQKWQKCTHCLRQKETTEKIAMKSKKNPKKLRKFGAENRWKDIEETEKNKQNRLSMC